MNIHLGANYIMTMKKLLLLSTIVVCAAQTNVWAQALPFIDSLMVNFNVGQCCDNTALDQCANRKPQCTIAPRLISFVLWIDSTKRVANDKIAEGLRDRYASLTDAKRFAIDTAGWPATGDPKSPLTLAVYFSGTCPTCKMTYRDLYYAVTSGKLKGKALLVAKPFSANPVNNALIAAHGMGKFNDFMLDLAKRNTRIDENLMLSIAKEMNIDSAKFKAAMENPALVKRVELANKEAVKNAVTHVPTFFISGQRYNSVLDGRWIIDAVEYVHETKR